METTFKKRITSPYQEKVHQVQELQKQSFDISNEQHPVRSSVRHLCGTYKLTAEFVEDNATLDTLKHVNGLIAILCTLRKDGKIVGLGRGSAVVNRMNRFLDRSISVAINGSFLSACNNATKVFDTLRLDESQEIGHSTPYGNAYGEVPPLITEKQRKWLSELISSNIDDADEKEERLSQLEQLTKEEASQMIQSFMK